MEQSQATATPAPTSVAQRWPEALREQPRPPDAFPRRLFLFGLIPGLVGAILLIAAAIYLEQRANRQILYLTPQGKLATVRADGADAHELEIPGLASARAGMPHWAPDRVRFAAPVIDQNVAKVLVTQLYAVSPILIETGGTTNVLLPGRPWSFDSAYLALVRSEQESEAELLIADVRQARAFTVSLALEPRAHLDWRRQANELLVTARTDAITPTLYIVGVDGQARSFDPQDQQQGHADGAWSPDGQQIAYVAGPDNRFLAGSIWIANSDGGGARAVVMEGMNFAPVWAPRGDLLFFTRWLTETDSFELYRIRPDGQELTRVGAGTSAWRNAGVDRSALMDWSPDGSQMFFQGFDEQQQRVVHKALYDGSNPQLIAESGAGSDSLVVRWTPASRALLVANQFRSMVLRWVDQDRPAKQLPQGGFPSIQP